MSTRVVRSLEDCCRHDGLVELVCRCGHSAALDVRPVLERFRKHGWSRSLEGACWLPSAHARFYCLPCFRRGRGKVRPVRIGPGMR